jgi:hypothetical protein
MNPIGMTVIIVLVSAVSASAGWAFRDARARGLPIRKALTWAALQGVEFPVFLVLYRRIRPRRLRGEVLGGPTRPGTATGERARTRMPRKQRNVSIARLVAPSAKE